MLEVFFNAECYILEVGRIVNKIINKITVIIHLFLL